LDERDRERTASLLGPVKAEAGHILRRADAPAERVYLLTSGAVELGPPAGVRVGSGDILEFQGTRAMEPESALGRYLEEGQRIVHEVDAAPSRDLLHQPEIGSAGSWFPTRPWPGFEAAHPSRPPRVRDSVAGCARDLSVVHS
jgi:hypothetical protein